MAISHLSADRGGRQTAHGLDAGLLAASAERVRCRTVSDGQMSHWGAKLKPKWTPEHSEQISQIFTLARADGSHRLQLTRGEKGASSPQFSSNGRYVYFSWTGQAR